MTFELAAIIIALFFAMNIGASGSAASMGAAYGAGAVKKRRAALLLVGAALFAGAFVGSGEVVKTIGEGIIPTNILSVEITVVVLAAACVTLFLANVLGIPLSTSEVTVGSIVGAGIAYQSLYLGNIMIILLIWLIFPFAAYGMTYVLGKMVPAAEKKLESIQDKAFVQKALVVLLISAGCYEAFSAGMNNVANAAGPLVGAGILEAGTAILWGGLFVSLGAVLLGGKVLETNAKKITDLSLLQGSLVSFTSGTLVLIASVLGMPVPLTQATTMSIIGIGASKSGMSLWKSAVVKRILLIWIISPVSSMVVSYLLIQTMIEKNGYSLIIVLGAVVMSFGYASFIKPAKKKFKKNVVPIQNPSNPQQL